MVPGGHAAMGRKREFLEELRARARALHALGLGPGEIARRLLGPEDFQRLFSAGDFSRRNLISAFLPDWPGPARMPSRRRASR
jgi:hypothetical protein